MSGRIKGLGPSTARTIVDKYGTELIDILSTDRYKELADIGIRYLTGERLENIKASWNGLMNRRIILTFLQKDCGLGVERSNRAVDAMRDEYKTINRMMEDQPANNQGASQKSLDDRFLDDLEDDPVNKSTDDIHVEGEKGALSKGEQLDLNVIQFIRENPYRLRKVKGIGFAIADEAARMMGVPRDSSIRLAAALEEVLEAQADNGGVWLDGAMLMKNIKMLLGADADISALRTEIGNGLQDGRFRSYNKCIADARAAKTEIDLGEIIATRILNAPKSPLPFPTLPEGKPPLHETQEQGLRTLLKSGFGVLTGGPGRGKTFMIEMLATAANEANLNILLLAPTGKASRVMMRATGGIAPCMTAQKVVVEDRMIRAGRVQPGGPTVSRLQMADIIVIDESSMADQILAYEVLKAAAKPNVRFYLVGDVDQLQSVGPGRVLRDVIAVEDVPVVRLTKNFRTGAGSSIPDFAEAVNSGIMPPKNLSDCRYVQETALMNKAINAGADPADLCASFAQSQFLKNGEYPLFLAAQYKGDFGINALNEAMRKVTNPPADDKAETSDKKFRVGDAVMCTVNDYNLNVFNGETGKIEYIEFDEDDDGRDDNNISGETIGIRMDEGKELVRLAKKDMHSWVFAWAISIHKSQGSQAEHICLVLSQGHQFMLNKEMLYTGATRAKTMLTIIGDDVVIERSVKKKSDDHRITFLTDRINQALDRMKKKDDDEAKLIPEWIQ